MEEVAFSLSVTRYLADKSGNWIIVRYSVDGSCSRRDRSARVCSKRRSSRGDSQLKARHDGRPGIASGPGEAGSSDHGDTDRLERENAARPSSYRVHGRFGRERSDVGECGAERRESGGREQRGQKDAQQLLGPIDGARPSSEQQADRGGQVRDGRGQVTPALLRPHLLSHLSTAQGQQASCQASR